MKALSFFFSLLLCIFVLHSNQVNAQEAKAENLPLQAFSMLPVAQEGRIKPMQEFARRWLIRISSQEEIDQKPASYWLAETLFSRDSKLNKTPLFAIEDEVLRQRLHLDAQMNFRYSATQLQDAFSNRKDELAQSLDRWQRDLPLSKEDEAELALYLKLKQWQQLRHSFSAFTSLPDFLGAPEEYQSSYFSLLPKRNELNDTLKELSQQHGTQLDAYNDDELNLLGFGMRLSEWESEQRQNSTLRIIPVSDGDWLSPWQSITKSQLTPQNVSYIKSWIALGEAWRSNNMDAWQKQLSTTKQQALELAGDPLLKLRLVTESFYQKWQPFTLAAIMYLTFAALMALPFLPIHLQHMLYWSVIAVHGGALLTRITIMERMPVSNLHESVLFVSFLLSLSGVMFRQHAQRRMIWCLLLLSCGALLLIGEALIDHSQDRLPILAAVLNSNFWLGTHVISITIGYALSILCGLLAHLQLWKMRRESRILIPMSVAALLFTAIGTWLGGVWADQSWGRFWGWDPKENGALAIVLWLSWLLHYRYDKGYHPVIYLCLTALLNVVVAMAWFGVNLLGVGLHSYGFSSAAVTGLFAFTLIEVLLIALLGIRYHHAKDS